MILARTYISSIRILALSAPLALALIVASCGSAPPPVPPPPEVTIQTVSSQTIENIVELPGRVQAFRTAEVRARVDGIVQARLYEEGSDVGAGKALFRIDPRQLSASLGAVEAALQRNQATAANAAQDVARYRGLITDQAISKQENDAAIARLRTAQADVAQARAQVQSARLSLGYATVTAPISGRVGRAQVTEGALVSAGAGTLLTTIEQTGRIYVNFAQSSSDILRIRQDIASGKLKVPPLGGVAVTLILENGSTFAPIGRLDFLDLSIDETTGTAALRAEFPNPGRQLLPGQFVRARIEAGQRPDGITVPQRAVRISPQGPSVMVIGTKSDAVARPVKLGDLQGGNWVITDGLKPGDRVIVDGLQKVMPGQPVRIAAPGKRPSTAPAR
jgi:membrane fusion protein, multidrug efflux system